MSEEGAGARSRPGRWIAVVAALAVAAFGVGLLHALSQTAFTQVLSRPSGCTPLTGARVSDEVIVHDNNQPVFYEVRQRIVLAGHKNLARALINRSDPASTQHAESCLFGEPAGPNPPMLSSVTRGVPTFTDSAVLDNGLPLSASTGWSAAVHPHSIDIRFDPAAICSASALPRFTANWQGSDLTLTIVADHPARVWPLPDSLARRAYSWTAKDAACGALPHIVVQVPISLRSYAATKVVQAKLRGIPVDELAGWSDPVLLAVFGLLLALRSRRSEHRPGTRWPLIALLALVPAAADLNAASAGFIGSAEVVAVLGLIGVLLLGNGRTDPYPRSGRVALAGFGWLSGAVLAAAVAAAAGEFMIGEVWASLGLETLALLMLIAIGVIGYRQAAAVRLGRLSAGAVRVLAAASAIAVAYCLGNIRGLFPPAAITASEFVVLRYALAPFAIVVLAIALAAPLARYGPTGTAPVIAGLFGWSLLAHLPDLVVAGVAVPVGVVLLTLLICLVIRFAPEPKTAHAPKLRGTPRTSPVDNSLLALRISAVLAIIPVGYFAYTALNTLPVDLREPGPEPIFLIAGVVGEIALWLLTGVIYAAISPRLPGNIGPVRSLVLPACWLTVAFALKVGNAWLGFGQARAWAFFGFQLFLFIAAFSVIWDAYILHDDPWRHPFDELREAYHLQRARAFVLYASPLLIAIIVLGQQLATGSGIEFVKSALDVGTAFFTR